MSLLGHPAIVTGGASGLGEAVVRMLRASASPVTVLDRDEERGDRVAAETGALFVPTDIGDPAQIVAAHERGRATHGTPRIVVNAAAVAPVERVVSRAVDRGGLVRHAAETFRRAVEINLIGAFELLATAAQAMAEDEPIDADGTRGVIVNVSSTAATDGQSGQVAYAATKAALVGLGLPAARDLGRYGIRVVAIMPGAFDTPGLAGLPDAVVAGLRRATPFPPRLGYADEFAATVRTAIESPMLNGTAIRLDGGMRM